MDSDYDFPKISVVGPVGSPCLVFQRDSRPISKPCLAHEARSYSLGNPGTGGSAGGPGNLQRFQRWNVSLYHMPCDGPHLKQFDATHSHSAIAV